LSYSRLGKQFKGNEKENNFKVITRKKKILGIVLIILGFLALITPFSPGSWLLFIGLELLGFRIVFKDKFFSFLKNRSKKKR